MKTVEEWAQYYDAKDESIINPIELVEHCAGGVPFAEDVHRKAILEPVIEKLELEPHHEFLEIGCGSGLFLKAIEKKVKKSIGVDISKRMLNSFTCKSEKFLCAAHNLPFEKESFDRVLMYSVAVQFESFEYLVSVINHVMPLLRKNGIFLVGDLLLGEQNKKSQYIFYDKHRLIDYLDTLGYPYSIVCPPRLKRTINNRQDVIIYKDDNN